MALNLFLERAVPARPAEEAGHTRQQDTERRHDMGSSRRLTTPTVRIHRSVAVLNCFRPGA